MAERVWWTLLYFALGWEIPCWGPAPGVWLSSEEFLSVVTRMDCLVERSLATGITHCLHLPLSLHRQLAVAPGAATQLPLLSSRVPLLSRLIQQERRLLKPALRQQDAVRQFTFK